jgi:hypothetical protein
MLCAAQMLPRGARAVPPRGNLAGRTLPASPPSSATSRRPEVLVRGNKKQGEVIIALGDLGQAAVAHRHQSRHHESRARLRFHLPRAHPSRASVSASAWLLASMLHLIFMLHLICRSCPSPNSARICRTDHPARAGGRSARRSFNLRQARAMQARPCRPSRGGQVRGDSALMPPVGTAPQMTARSEVARIM